MGRSQLKHRSARGRGRGQGDSARGGRGGNASTESGGGGKPKRSGGRALGSNAFRYEERSEEHDGDDDENLAVDASAAPTRRQFFAGEKNYRDMGDTKESYFRTKAMQRWEADDDDDDDTETQVAASTVGVMDFTWIEEQLRAVAPSLRYQIDAKYCVDFAFEQPVDDELREPQVAEDTSTARASSSIPDATTTPVPTDATRAPAASELDDLLALSSAVATQSTGASKASAPVVLSTASAEAGAAPPGNDGQEENLEDWLDDVLDM